MLFARRGLIRALGVTKRVVCEIRSHCCIYYRNTAPRPGNLPSRYQLLERRVHDYVRGLCRRRIAAHRWVGVVSSAALGIGVPRAGVGICRRPDGRSFWSQLEETLRQTASEPHSLVVVIVKFLLWGTCVVSLALSFQRVTRPRAA